MADFTVGMTGVAELDDSLVTEYKAEFIAEYEQENVMDQFVEYARDINAKSISFPRYNALTVQSSPLTAKEDPDSEAMGDSEVILTPAEYGNVLTTTKLVDLQSGGRATMGAMKIVANNMAHSRNKQATLALEATSNVLTVAASEGATVAGDTLTPQELNRIYNKMSRANVPFVRDGLYIAFLHDDQIHDLRNATGAGSWQDINKQSVMGDDVLRNAVGIISGFIIVRNNDVLINADGGSTTVDTYHATFLGANGLGHAESFMPQITITGPFDKLGRFLNIGWYGVYQYKIIEPDAVWKLVSASSVGANS